MIAHRLFVMMLAFITVVAIGGCSSVPTQPAQQNDQRIWRTDNGEAKIFFYAVYDNPADEPPFPETFRFRIDSGYAGEVDKDRFIETKVSPGAYLFTVDEIDWGGNVIAHANLNKQVRADDVLFIAAHFPAERKPLLSNTNKDQGIKDTNLRKRIDPCESLTTLCGALF